MRTRTALAGTFTAAALTALAAAAPAQAAAPTRAASLDCTAQYEHDNRIHGYCSGDGAWTLHIWCWPGIERHASTVTHGWGELSLGCGPIQIQDWKITTP
ncbi:hypothetical protein [Actinoallomurus sp. CA-150999]|uniref:hypothetical protein n=1 Tax=Actinoallomurus sp. CA-150999 TaxID=3239887 RepID=UPI003D8AF944